MSRPPHRRHVFLGCLALAGCFRAPRAMFKPMVSIARMTGYSGDLTGTIRRILIEDGVLIQNRRVVLKPNLIEFDQSRPINTNAVFVAAVAEAFQSLGAKTVRIAEGPGHRRATLDLAEAAGYFFAVPRFEQNFTDLNIDDVSRVHLADPFSRLRELYLPHTALSCDLLVTLPKMKTHHWAGATLSMKNLFGVVPGSVYGWPKNPLHWAGIDESVADLHQLFPNQFCIVDGIEAMEGNGPVLGTPKHMGLIVAGSHPLAVDITCCRLMHIDPSKIGYLKLALSRARWACRDIVQTGEPIQANAARFALPAGLENLRLEALA